MRIAFVDESSQAAANQFTVCGLTSIEADDLVAISETLAAIRSEASLFPNQALKWTMPNEWEQEIHTNIHRVAKARVMELCASDAVDFFGYVHFNHGPETNKAERNAKYGFNTLLGAFNRWLESIDDHAIVVFGRMEWAGAFAYLAEKFTCGLTFPTAWDRADEPLSRILSVSIASARMSNLCSLNDVYTGALNYIANVDHAANVRRTLVRKLALGMPRDKEGIIAETSFFQRPKQMESLSQERRERYEQLRIFMNAAMKAQSR